MKRALLPVALALVVGSFACSSADPGAGEPAGPIELIHGDRQSNRRHSGARRAMGGSGAGMMNHDRSARKQPAVRDVVDDEKIVRQHGGADLAPTRIEQCPAAGDGGRDFAQGLAPPIGTRATRSELANRPAAAASVQRLGATPASRPDASRDAKRSHRGSETRPRNSRVFPSRRFHRAPSGSLCRTEARSAHSARRNSSAD